MNRARRRAMLDAHYYRIDGHVPGVCQTCASYFDDVAYQSRCSDAHYCRDCALNLVQGDDARPTLEMAPITDAEAMERLLSNGEMRLA